MTTIDLTGLTDPGTYDATLDDVRYESFKPSRKHPGVARLSWRFRIVRVQRRTEIRHPLDHYRGPGSGKFISEKAIIAPAVGESEFIEILCSVGSELDRKSIIDICHIDASLQCVQSTGDAIFDA